MSLEGRHLGRYRLLEPLGSGGMSVVYRGVDTSLHREVAVKVLHPHLARQQEARARLAREARAVARLQRAGARKKEKPGASIKSRKPGT